MLKNIIECCANSVSSALIGIEAGANRIELCANLEKGGTTPKYKDIKRLRKLTDVKIHILLLPEANHFIYNNKEFQQIISDIKFCKKNGCDGVVIGALNKDLSINIIQTKQMVEAAKPMKVKQSSASVSKAKLSKAKRSSSKPSKAKQSQAKLSKAKQS